MLEFFQVNLHGQADPCASVLLNCLLGNPKLSIKKVDQFVIVCLANSFNGSYYHLTKIAKK